MALTQVEIDVCRFVSANPSSSMNEIKQGVSDNIQHHAGIYVATKRMSDQGFLSEDSSNKAFTYSLNPDHSVNFEELEAI